LGFDIEVLAELYPTETTAGGWGIHQRWGCFSPSPNGRYPDINFELLTVINHRINESQVTILDIIPMSLVSIN
jgi:hypothetical protein